MFSRLAKQKFETVLRDYYVRKYRDFPWRETRNPYRILVSEIMLQQTQAVRVVEYYQKFIREFPHFEALAAAPPLQVLRLWQGLGYNRRALFLHRAAQAVIQRYGGALPCDVDELMKLPGVGENTAGAVIAYAFNRPAIFIETNIRKALINHFFQGAQKVSDAQLRNVLPRVIDSNNPRRWYLAVVDYGADLSRLRAVSNSRSLHYRAQGKFEGSSRQLRSAILRFVLNAPMSTKAIMKQFESRKDEIPATMNQLRKEGFIVRRGGKWVIIS